MKFSEFFKKSFRPIYLTKYVHGMYNPDFGQSLYLYNRQTNHTNANLIIYYLHIIKYISDTNMGGNNSKLIKYVLYLDWNFNKGLWFFGDNIPLFDLCDMDYWYAPVLGVGLKHKSFLSEKLNLHFFYPNKMKFKIA